MQYLSMVLLTRKKDLNGETANVFHYSAHRIMLIADVNMAGAMENHKKRKKKKQGKTKHTPWAKILQKCSDKETVFH